MEAETLHPEHNAKDRLVTVEIDGKEREIAFGEYVVSALKAALGVPPEKELDEIVGNKLKELQDGGKIHIEGHEKFVSHERSGGSS